MPAVRNLTSPLSEVEFGDNNSHMNIDLNIPNTFDDTLVMFSDNIEKEMEGIESIIQEDEDIACIRLSSTYTNDKVKCHNCHSTIIT